MRLRKGFYYEDIGKNFGVSRTTTSKNIDRSIKALKREFVIPWATENDASITKKLFEKEDAIMRILKPNDIMLVDRGFSDCVNFLCSKNFEVMMPSCVINHLLQIKPTIRVLLLNADTW